MRQTGIQADDLLWFSFEAEAKALPPEWIAHPKDLIPLVETNSAARERERTARLKELERQLAALHTESRLALKKEDFVRVKELAPLIAVAQKKIDDFMAKSSSPTNSAKANVKGSPKLAGARGGGGGAGGGGGGGGGGGAAAAAAGQRSGSVSPGNRSPKAAAAPRSVSPAGSPKARGP